MAVSEIEPIKEIVCGRCGARIKYKDLPELKEEDMGVVALDHDDHILVIKYDRFGIIRGADPYDKLPSGKYGVLEITCPKCGTIEKVTIPEEPSEYGFAHSDHVMLVHIIEPDLYTVETHPLIHVKRKDEMKNVIRLLNLIGVERLSSLLAELVIYGKKGVFIPVQLMKYTKPLLDLLEIKNIAIRHGPMTLLDDKYRKYFEKMLEEGISIQTLEKIKRAILMIYVMGEKIAKEAGKKETIEFLESLKDSDMYPLLITYIRENYGPIIPRKR